MKVYKIKVNGKLYKVELESVEETASTLEVNEKKEEVVKASTGEGNEVLSPIQGNVINVLVKVGQKVKKGDVLVLIEAMKLENEVNSPFDGEVVEVLVDKGNNVTSDQLLMKIK